MGLAAALGLTAIIMASRWLYEIMRWGGIVYLLWLAWEGWRGDHETSASEAEPASHDSTFFVRGLTTNLLNPKAGLFYVAILPTFIDEAGSVVSQALMLSIVYVAIATSVHSGIALLADAARPWLENGRRQIIARRVLSVLQAIIAIWLLALTRCEPG